MLGRLKVRMLKAVSLDSSKKSCSEFNKSVKSVAILISSHHYIVRKPLPPPREGGGNCLKYLERGWNRKEGRGNKDLKKGGGGKLGQGVGALKGGGDGTPLPIMHYQNHINDQVILVQSFHFCIQHLLS